MTTQDGLAIRATILTHLRELAAICFRQSRFVLAGFVVVFAATLLYGVFLPRYEAHFKVLLRHGRSDPVVSSQPCPGRISHVPPSAKKS